VLKPCLPVHWPAIHITFRYRSARYEIEIENLAGAGTGTSRGTLDGVPLDGAPFTVALIDDGAIHQVRLVLAKEPSAETGSQGVPVPAT